MSDPDLTLPTKITGTGATTVVDGASYSYVSWLSCTEITGATPNLTVEVYDGTTSTYFEKTRPITASQERMWYNIPLSPIQKLRVTSSAGNQIDVIAGVVTRRPSGA